MNKLQLFPVKKSFDDKKQKWLKVPAIPKGTNWQDYSGGVDGADNYGLVIPSGVVVFDIDTQKGVTCSDVDDALGCRLDWDNAELQTTVSGGKHYVFSLPDGVEIKQGTDLLGVIGFDTRTSGKGWICCGEGYEDETMTGLPDAIVEESWPKLAQDAINLLSCDVEIEEYSDLMSVISSETLDISESDIASYVDMLTSEQAEHSDTWLKVGMAIYHQTKGSDFGWRQFDKFSQKCTDKYNKETNKKRWDSFGKGSRNNPVTFASLISLVGGAKAKSELVVNEIANSELLTKDDITASLEKLANCKLDNLQLDTALKKISEQYKQLTGTAPTKSALQKELKRLKKRPDNDGCFVDDYVFLTGIGEYMNRDTKTTMGPRSFNVKHNRETPVNSDGEIQTATSYADNLIDCVHAAMYVPAFGDIFTHGSVDYFNTYIPNNIKSVEDDPKGVVDKIKGHIAHLLPDEYEQQLVINYLAFNVQNPGVKIHWAMLLQGVQGDGKSLLAEMMQLILGINNVRVMNPQTLESNFTGWAVGQCMTFIEELKIDNYRKYEVINNIKPYVTNSTIEVTKKGQDPMVCINTTNYFALTNFKDAIPIDDNDRRYCILFSQWQRKDKLMEWMDKNPSYYPDLYELMRENIGVLLHWLKNHEIPKSFLDMKRAPLTNAKNTMIDLSKSDAYMLVEDAINEFESDMINSEVVNVTALIKQVSESFDDDYRNFPKTSALKNVLLDMGYHNIGRYKNSERKNQLIYCKDDKKKAIEFSDVINDCPF